MVKSGLKVSIYLMKIEQGGLLFLSLILILRESASSTSRIGDTPSVNCKCIVYSHTTSFFILFCTILKSYFVLLRSKVVSIVLCLKCDQNK
jgi:hypothetical protein